MNHEDILKTAVERYENARNNDRENREAGLEDMRFAQGIDHWPEAIRKAREDAGLPCLTINRCPQSIRQVTGDIRRTNPAIKVVSADGAATPEIAEIKAGLIRQIESSSSASDIYEGAAENAAKCAIGNFRIIRQYADKVSFDQELRIKPIRNPFAVTWDDLAEEPTRQDARYCFIEADLDIDDFKEQYPKAKADGWQDDEINDEWCTTETIRVVEYYWKERTTKTIGMDAMGNVVENPSDDFVGRFREVEIDRIMWAKMTAHEILEGPVEEPGEYIPVVAVVGEEDHIGDQVVRTSVIRHAKDPQRLYNYGRSTQAEVHGLQPKAPYILTADMIAGFEGLWKQANKKALPYLVYNPDRGAPGAKPERQAPPQASSALQVEVAQAIDDMKATTGIYDAGLGMRSNETSGKAIEARKLESDISTSIYVDNLSKSIRHCGTILLDLMRHVYDSERVVQILGEDGKEKLETINKVMMNQTGMVVLNDMLQGKYDSVVSTGPSYTTQREEAADGMMRLIQAMPETAPAIAGSIVRNLDWPGSGEIADRLDRMAPPGVIQKDPEEMTPEEVQAMQQQQQEAQRQKQIQEMMMQLEIQAKNADAISKQAKAEQSKADAMRSTAAAHKTAWDAQETRVDIDTKEFELALMRAAGLDGATARRVVQQVTAPTTP